MLGKCAAAEPPGNSLYSFICFARLNPSSTAPLPALTVHGSGLHLGMDRVLAVLFTSLDFRPAYLRVFSVSFRGNLQLVLVFHDLGDAFHHRAPPGLSPMALTDMIHERMLFALLYLKFLAGVASSAISVFLLPRMSQTF